MRTRWIGPLTLLAALAAPAQASDLVYFDEDGGGGNPRGLYDLDSTTGISTLRATVGGGERFFTMDTHPTTGVVYGVSVANGSLWTIDINSGATSYVVGTGIDALGDIAFDPTTGVLYGLGRNSFILYTIDITTGSYTNIGTTPSNVRTGLCFSPGGQLYACDLGGGLYAVDKTNASTAFVGSSGPGPGLLEDAVYAAAGQIFVTDWDGEVYQIDPGTGARTFIASTAMGGGCLAIIEAPGAVPPPTIYCTAKLNSLGCTPAIGYGGPTSQPLSGANDYDVDVVQLINNKNGIVFYGYAPHNFPFQGGWLCVTPPILRTPVQQTGGNPPPNDCSGQLVLRVNDPAGVNHAPASVVYFQGWSRDPADPTGFGTSLSDAIRLTYQ